MKNYSIWKDTIKGNTFPKLEEDKKVDVLIIGGGITGVSSFYHLKDSNLQVILVEQNKIGMATTGNSTGKLTFMQNDLIDKIKKDLGKDIASKYLASQIDAINLVKDIIDKENINCDLKKTESIIYTNKEDEIDKLKELKDFFEQNKISIKKAKNKLVKSKYEISASETYMFHPIKFIYGLLKNSQNIYEETSIKKIVKEKDYYLCYTNNYVIQTKWVIIASHYPYFNLPFLFPLKGSIEKSYLSASKTKGENTSLISYSYPFISIRTYKDYLIYLSNSHSINMDTDDKRNFEELKKKISDLKLQPEYLWSNSDIMTNDGMPYIGKIKEKMLIATGYNTWGLASSVLAGKILSDIIKNKENKYIELFNPKRKSLNQIMGGINNSFKSFSGYISGMKKQENIQISGNSLIYNGHRVLKKCPHMGCSLLFNETENTWDCPCHGSRFSLEGDCLNAPANKSIKK